MATLKILAIGSVLGSFKALFSKVKAIDQKHGKFDAVLATGDFFGPTTEDLQENELLDLLDEKLEVPLQFYVMQGEYPLPQAVIEKVNKTGGQVCSNVYLLNKSGIFSTAHGLRIACFSGSYAPEKFYGKSNGADLSNPYFTASTLKQLLNQPSLNPVSSNPNSLASIKALAAFQHIDILLTHTWSTSIAVGSTTMPTDLQPELAPQLDELVRKAKPRYYFTSCGGKFWEREPFCWAEENNKVTRFVSLGHFGDTSTSAAGKKERWFYAFSISLAPPPATPQPPPPKATPNPYVSNASEFPHGNKRSFEQTSAQDENHIWSLDEKQHKGSKKSRTLDGDKSRGPPPQGYVCRICKSSDHFIQECPQKRPLNEDGTRKPPEGYVCRACASDQHYIKDCPVAQSGPREIARSRGPPREIQPDECWFCLSNPNLVKHLIVAIGNECYVTLPKGQLPLTQTSKSPLAPVPGGGHVLIVPISHYPTLSSVPSDLSEPIISEMKRYQLALRQCYAKYKALPVTFEVSRLTGKGGHAHIQVVPIANKYVDNVEAAFRNHAERLNIKFFEDTDDVESKTWLNQNYFRVELPNGKILIHVMKPGTPFDLQFGRMVLADLIGVPERLDWKVCAQSDADEKKDADAFKSVFAEFLPSEE